jgi:hypothetical protein
VIRAPVRAGDRARRALASHDARLARLVRGLRTYLRLREAAGPDSPAVRLAARALRRACDDALAPGDRPTGGREARGARRA